MIETQETIATWCEATFGPATPIRLATRANEEMAELLKALTTPVVAEKIAEEAGDVIICLSRLARHLKVEMDLTPNVSADTDAMPLRWAVWANNCLARIIGLLDRGDGDLTARGPLLDLGWELARLCDKIGMPLMDAINRKMTVLKSRKWALDGSGCGYHVKQEGAA